MVLHKMNPLSLYKRESIRLHSIIILFIIFLSFELYSSCCVHVHKCSPGDNLTRRSHIQQQAELETAGTFISLIEKV